MIGLFLLGLYIGGALYALASSAFVLTHGSGVLNADLERALECDDGLREKILRQILISALLWPIAVCFMATGRTPPW